MIRNLTFKISLAILATCSALFAKPQSASAQVNMSVLTKVAKSCQKDTKSSEYYKQMGFDDDIIKSYIGSHSLLDSCIQSRYYHALVSSKFPWLASTGEMIQGYPGSVLVSTMANALPNNSSLLDCIVSGDPSNSHCAFSIQIFADLKVRNMEPTIRFAQYGIYVCPSCVVAHDDVMSEKSMIGNFIQWFLSLDKPTRRKVMSIVGDGQKAANTRLEMNTEADRALSEYNETRKKVEQQEQDRRRREVIGN